MNKLPNPRTKRGQFQQGVSGNPSGRPPGSRNRATLLAEELLLGEAERLTRKVVDLALDGDRSALRLCMERLLPPRRDRTIQLDLPPTGTIAEISVALATVTAAIGEGQITPHEGEVMSHLLAAQKEVIVTAELERRLDKAEESVNRLEEEKARR